MSTSDAAAAAELQLRAAPPAHRTPATPRSNTPRLQRDTAFDEGLQPPKKNNGEETLTVQDRHISAIRQERAQRALTFGAERVRQQDAAHWAGSEVHIQKPHGPRFTSTLHLTLYKNKPKPQLKPRPDSCPNSLTEPRRAYTEHGFCQVNRQTSAAEIPAEAAREDVITAGCTVLQTTRPLRVNQTLSNGDCGPHEYDVPHTLPCQAQTKRTFSASGELKEDTKDHAVDLELSKLAVTMLSSTVATVLAPHWNGRLRRTKRFEGNSGSQGSLQDVSSTLANRAHEETRNQRGTERVSTGATQAQQRVPFLNTRRSTVDWSTKSDPSKFKYESERKMIHTVSVDVNSGRMDNRILGAGASGSVATIASPLSPLSLDPNEQRRTLKPGLQGAHSTSSSKPLTSSMLLSLRRLNSGGNSPNAACDENPAPSDQVRNSMATHFSQTFKNEKERPKPVLPSTFISYRPTDTVPIHFPSSFKNREQQTNISESTAFPKSTINSHAEDAHLTQQPQTCSKPAFLNRGPSATQQSCRDANKNTNLFPERMVSSPRHCPYDPSALLKTHSLPRRTTLTSTSWWKQVTQEGSSPQTPNATPNNKEQLDTPLVPSRNGSSDAALPSVADKERFSSKIPDNRDNNNTSESVCKGNTNLVRETQRGAHNLKQRNAGDQPEPRPDRLFKQLYSSSSLNNREPQKPHNLADVLSRSKINRVTAKTTLTHPTDLSKGYVACVTESPPTIQSPQSADAPTDGSKYSNDQRSSRTNSSPTSPHNLTITAANNPSPIIYNTTCGLPPSPNTKTSSSFHLNPVSSQTGIYTSSYSCSSSQTSKFNSTANTTPLGFERSYASIPRKFPSKNVSSLIPPLNTLSKMSYMPVPTAPVTSCTIGNHPATTTAPSPSLLSLSATPAITTSPKFTLSSPLTPPATPLITSPNYLGTSSPKEGFSGSPDGGLKKQSPRAGGKRVRRVTWEDSVDLHSSVPDTTEKPDPPGVPSSISPSRSPRSVRAPCIFNFLRSGSPTTSTSPLCSPTPKTSSIQVETGAKNRSPSSDSADPTHGEQQRWKQGPSDTMNSDREKIDLTPPRQERTPSVESGTVQCHSSAPLSLPSDFSSGYKLRYSSPPYSTLKSSRSAAGEPRAITQRSPLFQQASSSTYNPQLSLNIDPCSPMTRPASKAPQSANDLPKKCFPLQKPTESSRCEFSEPGPLNNPSNSCLKDQGGKMLLIKNRVVDFSSPCVQLDKVQNSPSTCVTETLVYTIKSKVNTATTTPTNTTPKHTAVVSSEPRLSQQPHTTQSKEASGEINSDQSSSGGSSAENPSQDDEGCNRRTKESMLSKNRFSSVESNNEQSPKRGRFALKKSTSTPNSGLSRSNSERAHKTNNKMDLVLNKLRQTFSTRRSDDDPSFPWKWRRTSQTPSVSGLSDISALSDVSADSAKALEEQKECEGLVPKDGVMGMEGTSRSTQNRYTIIQRPIVSITKAGDQFSVWSENSTPETYRDEQNACAGHKSESKTQFHLTGHSPAMHHSNFKEDSRTDYNPTHLFPTCRDPSPGRSSNPSSGNPTQFRKSTPSPRSPFSPFSSLSPVSPFPSPEVTDDNVFYSPKMHRRRESLSPCEPGEGISLGCTRRSRASTGPPSTGTEQDDERFTASYADLKYGIEPGRSYSVSSVLSSRPSGPGRISTGSRFKSVGDLSKSSSLSCGGNGRDLDQWATFDWTTNDSQPQSDFGASNYPDEVGKMRSRSLPRSLTRRLASWSSAVSDCQPGTNVASKPAPLWSPNMNICHFGWDTEGPPTPPPTPPLSPVSRRISTPPTVSSPTFPSPPGAPQSAESLSSRRRMPSRGYVSSLSTFEESSDSSSDTTTDDEYYLETGEGEEKETKL